jgi:hypothetical protein
MKLSQDKESRHKEDQYKNKATTQTKRKHIMGVKGKHSHDFYTCIFILKIEILKENHKH